MSVGKRGLMGWEPGACSTLKPGRLSLWSFRTGDEEGAPEASKGDQRFVAETSRKWSQVARQQAGVPRASLSSLRARVGGWLWQVLQLHVLLFLYSSCVP